MKIVEAIKIALPVFAEHKNSDWEVLETALIGAGIEPSLTAKLLEFMPLAFGRVFLDGMGIKFAENYTRYNDLSGQSKESKLLDEPVYAESFWAASQIVEYQAAGEAFNAVAFRSSELHAVNEALNAGSKPENLVTSPPHLVWNSEETDSMDLLQPKKKWQFWK